MLKNNSIDSKLLTSKVAIENGQNNAVISDRLADYGYDADKMIEGQELLDDAESKHALQKKEYGEQFMASDALDEALTGTNKTYSKHIKISRIAFRNQRGVSEALQLGGRRRQTYSGWMQQAGVFYENSLADETIIDVLDGYGIDETVLQTARDAVNDVSLKLAAQLKEKGEAQDATQSRDLALEKLLDWIRDYVGIAKIALEDESQLLEILGIVEPS
ncbi:MAG: hypothetical protein ABJP45_06570 [Cyclobacteriaceae bacterium]